MFNLSMSQLMTTLPGIVIGLTVHEFAHAYAAYRLGDATASQQGRLTLNPIKHIDPVGFLMLIIFQFGWAKPVEFNPAALKNPKRDEILIALAGPVSNIIMAFILFGVVKLIVVTTGGQLDDNLSKVLAFTLTAGWINIGLFVFNMIPLPPLDGSHIYMPFLKERYSGPAFYLQRYGTVILLGAILVQNNLGWNIFPISGVIHQIASVMCSVLGLPDFFR